MSRRREDADARSVAFADWRRAAKRTTALSVPPDEGSQRQARALVAAGMCAYENRAGLLVDLAEPKRPHDARAVWSAAKGLSRDHRRRVTGRAQ